MGSYLGPLYDCAATVTPREYISVVSSVVRHLRQSSASASDSYVRGVDCLAVGHSGAAIRALSDLVRQRPDDATAHRLLGMAHLSAGHLKIALRHLVTALRILRCEIEASLSLRQTLQAHLESARLRLVLLPLCVRLGADAAVRQLILDSLML